VEIAKEVEPAPHEMTLLPNKAGELAEWRVSSEHLDTAVSLLKQELADLPTTNMEDITGELKRLDLNEEADFGDVQSAAGVTQAAQSSYKSLAQKSHVVLEFHVMKPEVAAEE